MTVKLSDCIRSGMKCAENASLLKTCLSKKSNNLNSSFIESIASYYN